MGIKTDPQQLTQLNTLHQNGVIVYVVKYKSYFDYFFAYTHHKRRRIPVPELGLGYRILIWQPLSRLYKILLAHFDYFLYRGKFLGPYASGYYRDELLNGRAALLYLIEKKGFYQRFVKEKPDPIRYLIEMQQTIDKPIYLVPQLTIFDKMPHRAAPSLIDIFFGTKENPGKIRRFVILIRKPGKIFVEVSEALNLQEFIKESKGRAATQESLSVELRQRLLWQINRHRQSITGPLLKSSLELKENILTSNRLQAFMKNYAEKRKFPIQQVQKRALAYLDEIAARYNVAYLKVVAAMVNWVLKMMFEGIAVNDAMFNKIKHMNQKGPLIFVPCHKSHIDYLLISFILHKYNMPLPHVAAGQNLAFWPLGPLFRRCGAFFLRRSFRGAVLYSKVFGEYIQKILEEGYNIEFFIEGGRSRTGKPILPKLGFLSILLEAYKNRACEDLIFVPVYVGYDRILEESAYVREIEGGQKKPERFLDVLRARKFLKKRYGRIYLNFHEPLSLEALIAQLNTPLEDLSTKERQAFYRNLGFRMINAITQMVVVTPHGLVASAALNYPKGNFSFQNLAAFVELYRKYLCALGVQLADTLRLDPFIAVEQAFDAYVQRKIIERIPADKDDKSSEELFRVNVSRRPILEYYKNNCIAFFIPAAFTATAIIARDSFRFSAADLRDSYLFLRDLFKNEFAYDVDKPLEYFIRKSLKAFIDQAVVIPHPTLPATYHLTPAGLKKLKYFALFLKTYFESYWIVIRYYMRHSDFSRRRKAGLKKIYAMGNRMYKRGEIDHIESLSEINFKNAADYFAYVGIKDSEQKEKIDFFADAIRKYLNHLSA